MYAVVSTGGKQLKVEKGTEAVVEKLEAAVGDTVTFDVLFVADDNQIVTGANELASATVTAEVVEHFKGDKVVVFKFKKRKGYKRLKGHRQMQTRVVITEVSLSGGAKKAGAAKKAAEPVKAAAPVKTAPEAVVPKSAEPKAAVPEPPAQVEVPSPATEAADTCCATKSSGDPCVNKPKEGSKYCGIHAKKFES